MNIQEPTLLLDTERCRANIKGMSEKAARSGTNFRPHCKTHQSLEIGRWLKTYGVEGITVSSLRMAEYFAPEWQDITVAFPVNILEMARINRLAQRIQLNLLVEDPVSVRTLQQQLQAPVGYFIKIDVGYHRTGLSPERHDQLETLLAFATDPHLHFRGFLAHAGHTYGCRTQADILAIHQESVAIMQALKQRYLARFPDHIISLGDTPSCSVADNFTGIDEVRPGNFIFYDLTQAGIGSNVPDQIAVAMACPVVALHPERKEVILYGGGVHFSKDRLEQAPEGKVFGRVVRQKGDGWGAVVPDLYLRSLSQEHGILTGPADQLAKYKIGDLVLVLPVHSCMTADAMQRYLTLEGEWISRCPKV